MRKKNFLNADGYLIGNRIINPFGQPIPNPVATGSGFITDYRMNDLRSGNAGDRYRDGLNMYAWFAQHGATNADGLPFTPGDRIRGEQMSNGDIQFKAFKNGQPFTTAWSSDYFMPEHVEAMPIYSNAQINSSLLAGYGNYDPNPVGSVAAQAAALAAQGVQFNQAEGYQNYQNRSSQSGSPSGGHHHHHGQGQNQSNQQGQGSQQQQQPGEEIVAPSFTAPVALQAYSHLKVVPYSSTQYQAVSGKLKSGGHQTFSGTQMLINMSDVTAMNPNSNAEGDETAPVNPILAPEMITADKKGGMKICLPCTGSIIGLALGLGAAYYVTKHPALSKFHLKNNILQYSVYGLAVGALGYGIGFGINKLKK